MPIDHLRLSPDAIFEKHLKNYCVLEPVSGCLPEITIYRKTEFISGNAEKQAKPFLSSYCLHTFGAGEMMARWILDNPEEIKGKKVLDLGSGSGLVAIAAAMSGAAEALALDNDPTAARMIERNALANGVSVSAYSASHLDLHHFKDHFDILTACDVFYIEPKAISETLVEIARSGKTIYAGSAKEDAPIVRRYGSDLHFPRNFVPSSLCFGINAFHKLDQTTVRAQDEFQQGFSALRADNNRMILSSLMLSSGL